MVNTKEQITKQICFHIVIHMTLLFTRVSYTDPSVLLHQVGAELPIDSADADEAHRNDDGRTLLYVFSRGYILL
jgi:hypothetical protein